jgi:hypothetical protein
VADDAHPLPKEKTMSEFRERAAIAIYVSQHKPMREAAETAHHLAMACCEEWGHEYVIDLDDPLRGKKCVRCHYKPDAE